MSNISSIEKGNEFEKKVLHIIQELLIHEDFYLNSKKSLIYHKKGYYSEARKSTIIVDISIETTLQNASKYSILTIIECKNYNKKGVPIDDIEEFDSKISQIGEHNTKGIIVTNSYFQKSAISFATSMNIGLIQINEKNEIDWINYRKDGKQISANNLNLVDLSSKNPKSNFTAFYNKKDFSNLPSILIELGVIDRYNNKPKYINIPFRTENAIDEIIKKTSLDSFYYNDKLDHNKICQYLIDNYKVTFDFNSNLGTIDFNKILGKIVFNPLKISVSKELEKDKYRWRFTLAHEIGHLILHYDILQKYLDENIDNDTTINIEHDEVISFYNKRLEIQANIFASRLLIPQNKFLDHIENYFVRERIYKGYLYLDWQKCNIDLTNRLLIELQDHFYVSKEVARFRLISRGLLEDTTDISFKNK
jgi:Zn-dependent peptidase ImmA (M78 family)